MIAQAAETTYIGSDGEEHLAALRAQIGETRSTNRGFPGRTNRPDSRLERAAAHIHREKRTATNK